MANGSNRAICILAEIRAATKAIAFDGYYSGKHTKKQSRVHIIIRDDLNLKTVMQTAKRCECGGWTFSRLSGTDKCVCRHCGKQYFKKEFDQLTEKKLEASEIHDRHIYSVLLSGGDLREHAEENKLVFKDENGVLLGHLPMEYADHLASTYCNAFVLKNIKATEPIRHAVGVSPIGAV